MPSLSEKGGESVFNGNFSAIPNGIKDADDYLDKSWPDSAHSTDSEMIRPIRQCTVMVVSSDSDTDKATDNCRCEADTPSCLQTSEGHSWIITFPSQSDSVPL